MKKILDNVLLSEYEFRNISDKNANLWFGYPSKGKKKDFIYLESGQGLFNMKYPRSKMEKRYSVYTSHPSAIKIMKSRRLKGSSEIFGRDEAERIKEGIDTAETKNNLFSRLIKWFRSLYK